MKNSSVSARIPTNIAKRVDTVGLCTSDIINEALFKATVSIPKLEKAILQKKEELENLDRLLVKIKKERLMLESQLKEFFRETKIIYKKNPNIIGPRVKALYNKFKIPTDEYEFMKMMEEYTE